jgi:MFS family permease
MLGGALTHADIFGSSWRAVFLVNVPLGVVVLFTAPLLREDRAADRPRLDIVGTGLAIRGVSLVVYPLIEGDTDGWPVWDWGAMLAGLVVFAVFGRHQRWRSRHGRSPLIEASLFSNHGFPAALASAVLFFAVVNGLMLVIVLQLQLGLHADVLTAGLTLVPWSGGLALSSWLAGAYLVPRFGPRVMFAGLAVLFAGIVVTIGVYGTSDAAALSWPFLAALADSGLGLGLFTVPFFSTALGRVSPRETGSAAGLLNAVQQLGGTLGIALLGGVFLHTFRAVTPGPVTLAATAVVAAQNGFWLAAGLVAATSMASAFMIGSPLLGKQRSQAD